MKKILITGANRSIGLEAARQLLEQGHYVYLGSRSLANGQAAVEALKSEGFTNAEAVEIDVTSTQSVQDAHEWISSKTDVLDVLINNAGVSGGFPQSYSSEISAYKDTFDTNFFGVVHVTQVFMDLLRAAPQPRIVNVTSGLGSLTLHNDPSWKYYKVIGPIYNASKAALNMYTIMLAKELKDSSFKVNAVDPGFTATDFNHHTGTGTVEDAAARLVKCAMLADDGPTGTFFSDDNNPETGVSLW